jgi:sulfite reductase (ferredoxin)
MSKLDVESVKRASAGLRGTIPSELVSERPDFSVEAQALLKFHGVYQQDDRDARKSARETGADKDYSFMLRTKNPGGFLPADFYLAMDALADTVANGTIRVTTRGALQLHGVRKENLHATIAEIDAHLGSTLGACGDINRNVMAPPEPFADAAYASARDAARSIAELLTPRATAYYEIWQDGELVHDSRPLRPEDEPIYGAAFLPRKFKIAVAAAGDNSVDIFTNDLGVVPIVAADGTLEGYNLLVGGGLGMTHGKHATFPRLADEFAFVPPHRLLDAVRAIVVVQRDHGDRTNRKHARLKYLIVDRGLAWFRHAVEAEAGFTLDAWRPLPPWRVPEFPGWQEQGDGRFFYTVRISAGAFATTRAARPSARYAKSSRPPAAISSPHPIRTSSSSISIRAIARRSKRSSPSTVSSTMRVPSRDVPSHAPRFRPAASHWPNPSACFPGSSRRCATLGTLRD